MKTQPLKPYPEYKDSGTPWLGDMPAHWEVLPNRALFAEVNDRNHAEEQLLSVTIAKGVIRQSDLLANTSKKDSSNEDKGNYKLVQPRDIVYNKMRAWQGAAGVSNYRGIVSPAYIVVRPRGQQNPDYFHYLLRTPAFAKEAERLSYGITSDQWSLRAEDFKQIYCSLPPEDEQTAIVRFLAHSGRRISRLIRAKRRLIELLNEQKQAIIHRAVTRGLDPNARLKASGIDWLGEIPEHWELLPLKRRIAFQEGPGIMASEFRDQGIPLIRIAGMRGTKATLDGCNYLDPEMVRAKWSHFAIRPGDYLLSASASVGAACPASDSVVGAIPYTGIIRVWPLLRDVNMQYVRYFTGTRLFLDQVDMLKTGVGIEHYGPSHLNRMFIVLPPSKEQYEIARHLNNSLSSLEKQRSILDRQIDLIREYRNRLISDVVTGRLDVRDVELPALDEDEPLESWDESAEEEADEVAETEEIALADV